MKKFFKWLKNKLFDTSKIQQDMLGYHCFCHNLSEEDKEYLYKLIDEKIR